MGVSVLDLVGQIVYYPDMASIVGKKRGNKTYYYLVTSARVGGKPRIVDQQYLGSAEEVMARLSGAPAGAPERTQHKKFGDLAAVWGILARLGVVEAIDEVCGPRRADAGASVGTYLCLLYTSDAADEEDSVDLGGRRIIKKKKIKDIASIA